MANLRIGVLVTRELVRRMRPRSVIIDFSVDQGGCVETSRPTTVSDPLFLDENVLHYCVPNVPSLVARTATHVLTNAALPFIEAIARLGVRRAVMEDETVRAGVNTFEGHLVNQRVAASFGMDAQNLGTVLESRRPQ